MPETTFKFESGQVAFELAGPEAFVRENLPLRFLRPALALDLARLTAGSNIPARIAIIAITTNSSINVKPARSRPVLVIRVLGFFIIVLLFNSSDGAIGNTSTHLHPIRKCFTIFPVFYIQNFTILFHFSFLVLWVTEELL